VFALHYHDATKHHFNRFARSLGYLDWATQPDPFRRYDGAPRIELPREVVADRVPYAALFDPPAGGESWPIDHRTIGEFLRCSMGLSAWKQYQSSRWALRVNPSSGNLHPTECYIVWDGRVCHYTAREHALEVRAEISRTMLVRRSLGEGEKVRAVSRELEPGWDAARGFMARDDCFLVGLTSIFWREAWKYGERAFRYCQHDAGHAIGALRFAAAMLGWKLRLLPWADADVAAVLGVDRDDDYRHAEREDAECIALVTPGNAVEWPHVDGPAMVSAVREAAWGGHANALSGAQVEWPIIDGVAGATRRQEPGIWNQDSRWVRNQDIQSGASNQAAATWNHESRFTDHESLSARCIILQRRSAVAFDGRSTLSSAAFFSMLQRLNPCGSPWDAIDWPPQIHLALFVHRIEGLEPGIYAYLRDDVLEQWRAAMRPEFLWEKVRLKADPTYDRNDADANDPNEKKGLFLLLPMDVKWAGMRVSCDQDIAGDGFFSLGMIARFDAALKEHGEWFYRRLFWECGLIGQVLYLEAEAAGGRATGIGCFYDDAVHEVLGLAGTAWQSLYHFSMGMPVDDTRLTTESGYSEHF
jgi:SagB-type dehydrogenase family enzyme